MLPCQGTKIMTYSAAECRARAEQKLAQASRHCNYKGKGSHSSYLVDSWCARIPAFLVMCGRLMIPGLDAHSTKPSSAPCHGVERQFGPFTVAPFRPDNSD